MDSFLNFSMSMFCDERSAKLEQVKRDLENCGTADEKCALVQDLREAFKISLERDVNWTSKIIIIRHKIIYEILGILHFFLTHGVSF